jgi:hypothetical protein
VFDPRQITLDGTPDVSKRGQFKLSRFSGNLMADLQNLTNGRIPQAQLYAEGSYITSYLGDADDEFFLRHAYARVAEVDVGADSGFSIEAGSLDTLISDYGAVPTTVEGVVPIGSIDRGTLNNDKSARHQLQIRMRYRFSNRLEAGLAIEQPTNRDFVTAPGDTVLDRAPDVLARLRYVGADGWDTYHIAAIVRTFAVEDAADVEYVATGWGVSGLARMKNAGNTSAAYVGVAGGNGIGANIFGLDTAAVREMGSIQTFPAIGGYVGFAQQILPPDESEQSSLWSNFCYGIVATDLSNALALQLHFLGIAYGPVRAAAGTAAN